MDSDKLDWNVLVYCQNEEKRIRGCLASVVAALSGRRALITVIVNGSRDRTLDIARDVATAGSPIEIFQIAAGDKSNAINHFIYSLRSPARIYGGVEGAVYIAPTSFRGMEDRLEADPHAVAVTGVCTNGRTMKLATQETLTVGGRLHGQLHAFRPDFFDRMVARGIKLPLGLYWNDGLLGSMAAHNLDAVSQPWDNGRIAGVAAATYELRVLSPFKINDVRRQFRRKLQQMRGQIENLAISELIYHEGYEGLPENTERMVESYLTDHARPKVSWPDRMFQRQAIRVIKRSPSREPASLEPHRVLLN